MSSESDFGQDPERLRLEYEANLPTVVAALGFFGEQHCGTIGEIRGYLQQPAKEPLKPLRDFNYIWKVDEDDGFYKLGNYESVKMDSERIHNVIEENYSGFAPAFIDSFEAERKKLDSITYTLELSWEVQ